MQKNTLTLKELKGISTDVIDVFQRIQDQDWSILLDSGGVKRATPSYSIISYQPLITLKFDGQQLIIKQAFPWIETADLEASSAPVFSRLSELQRRVQDKVMVPNDTPALPFLVGWLGALSYDLNIFTDGINANGHDEFLLAPICLGFYANSIIFDHANDTLYWASIEGLQDDWILPILNSSQNTEVKPFGLQTDWQSNVDQTAYHANLNKIFDYLVAGDCYQVNYAQRFNAQFYGCEYSAYRALRQANQAPFSAFMRCGQSSILSVSPERFLSVKDGLVETKPIKGTRPRSQDPEEDEKLQNALLNSDKDRAENLMIVDLLRNDISKHCKAFSVQVPHLFALESYPAVHHMVSTVVGELKQDSSCFDLLGGAFPGGSITGCPKIRAMQIIDELETNKRSIYCGSIGYIGIKDDMDMSICIRTLLIEKGQVFCWAGGGIVIDSDPADEYQESLDKVAKILPILRRKDD